jgi:hypothetical protein
MGRSFAALGQIILGLACGAPPGAIGGLMVARRRIAHAPAHSPARGIEVWTGVALGLPAAIIGCYAAGVFDWIRPARPWWPALLMTAFVAVDCSTLGGIIATVIGERMRAERKGSAVRKRRKARPSQEAPT